MKNEEVNFPEKYALMPIMKQTGWETGLPGWEIKRVEEVVAYVAMECYLLEEVINYYKNGTNKSKFLVVFAKSKHDFSTEIKPFDNVYGVNTSGQYVDSIYDELEEVKLQETIINKKLIEESGRYYPVDKREFIKQRISDYVTKYVTEADDRRINPKVKTLRC